MNEDKGVWTRVSKDNKCPICDHGDWCCIGEKGICCMRSTEGGKLIKNGGYFYAFDSERPMPPPPRPQKPKPPAPDFGTMMRAYWEENDAWLSEEAHGMGVSSASLKLLGAAWAKDRKATAFPMYDATWFDRTRPIGIRLRTSEGKKFAVTGSSSGIFYPYGALLKIPSERILICEGPTDTAAALDMGCFAIGRAACRGGEEYVLSVLSQLNPFEVVIVTDNDSPGMAGAKDLMRHIKQPKRMLTPPTKDLRSFRQNGGTKELLEEMLKNIISQ